VFGCKGASRFGSHAQYTTVPADQLLATPSDIRDEEAASLPYAFVTAYRLLTDGLESRPESFFGKSVLVHGGAGAVGSMAVRMLRRWGAEVTISGRHADEQCAVALGACGALDLTATRARHDAARFDAIINCASFDDEPALVPLLGHDAKGLATIVHPLISTLDAHGWVRGAIAARRIWNKRAAAVRAAGAKRYRWVMFNQRRRRWLNSSACCATGS
jgi:NADPH:quinone reductase-like Zn-dependent oxidoreductase